MAQDPFDIDTSGLTEWRRAALFVVRPFLSWLLRLPAYQELYERAQGNPERPFAARALEALEIATDVAPDQITHIPALGPLIVASNHPHGAVDGLVLADILCRRRNDVRILTNHLLSRIPELRDLCFFVDPFGGRNATARSQAGLRAAHLWLRNGGALVVFPAGEVAHQFRASGAPIDPPWRTTVGRLAVTTGAPIVAAFVQGANSRLFYAAGRLHPSLRTALLPRELLKQRGTTVTVRLSAPRPALDLGAARDAVAITESIRRRVQLLAGATGRSRISEEISQLPTTSTLVESGEFQVFIAESHQIPATLEEIGRLREVTYQAIGEGTGRQLDLDVFDRHYLHLFLWDRNRNRVVGAYRIAPTDHVIGTRGVAGLYTRTLFRYDERLIARISPALELGRSFVRAEYQRNFNALLLLWKGIGQFVARHPQYRILFGPVSISARYSDSSHRLLMAFLRQNHLDRELANLVEAINPHLMEPAPSGAIPQSIEEANQLVSRTERDGKGIPVLLRQYLKLKAKLLGFNVDPNFGDALDALMMVDLTTVDVSILNRYLGREDTAHYLAYHRARASTNAA